MPKRSFSQYSENQQQYNYPVTKKRKTFNTYSKPYENPVMPSVSSQGTNEKKFKDTVNFLNVRTPTVGVTVPQLINGVAEGSDFTQRVGRKVTWSSITMRWRAVISPTTPWPANVRAMLVYDRQPNGVMPFISDIINIGGSGAIDDTSLNNLNNRDRFWVIMDKTLSISPNGPEIQFRKKFKRVNTNTQYKGITSAIDDISSGGFYLLFIPDSFSGQTDALAARVAYSVRMKFVDN